MTHSVHLVWALWCIVASLCRVACASSIVNLTSATFEDFVQAHDVVMVKFFAPWCGVCSDLAPIYEDTATHLDPSKDIRFARVDCVAEPSLCEQYRTPIYPTIRVFKGTNEQELYNGERTPEEMTSFVERRHGPPVTALTATDVEQFTTKDKVTIIAYISADDEESQAIFTRIAQDNLDYFTFGAVNAVDTAKAEGISQPGLVMYKHFDNRRSVYEGSFEYETIDTFLEAESTPLIGEFETKFAYRYLGKEALPWLGIFAETLDQRDNLAETLRPIASKHKRTLRFASIDPAQHKSIATKFGITQDTLPALAIRQSDGHKFVPSPDLPLNSEAVETWIDEYLEGNLIPTVQAKATPDIAGTGNSTVVAVSEQTFKDLVLDSTADVLVQFYAPWCGHCKRLAPVYEQLASLYVPTDPSMRIAKIDATADVIPDYPISSFPTIMLFPAGPSGEARQYNGNRSLQDLTNFIRSNRVSKPPNETAIKEGSNDKEDARHEEIGHSTPVKDEL